MNLTSIKIKNAKAKDKPYKLYDRDGLFLQIMPSGKLSPKGSRYWRLKYRFEGRERLLALGIYPEISLAEAREKCSEARKQLKAGIDPGEVKKATKQGVSSDSFAVVAEEWHSKNIKFWTPGHAETILSRLKRDVFPIIGKRPIGEIKAPEILKALRIVEGRGANETAHRIRSLCGQVFRYAIATGRAERDWAADLRNALEPVKTKHFAALTEPETVSGLLRAIDGYQGSFTVKCALKIASLTYVRSGELRQAEWSEINLDQALWCIPASRMKMREPHIVPLPRQAVEIFSDLKQLTGESRFVFPSGRSFHRAMSENAILAALRRMGYTKEEMTGHGFRAMARTMLDEILHFPPEIIEHQLAHAVRDPLGRAYNRTAHIEQRKQMMQGWADYLDKLKTQVKVVPFKKRAG
jgi:integrase